MSVLEFVVVGMLLTQVLHTCFLYNIEDRIKEQYELIERKLR